jgi:NADPH-dependent 2,4-dienoyl-CoA reductase/sulfur reductase-like enzyme/rhodanese-related sulfurtransferase
MRSEVGDIAEIDFLEKAMPSRRRVLVVGGVAGGASAAARLRRLDEWAEIVVFDRGPYISFANCGLPYYVGDIIEDEQKLLVASPELFRDRFEIDVRVEHEVIAIQRAAQVIPVRDLRSGAVKEERYDALVLAPGASSIRPPIPGIDLPGVFSVRTIPDSRQVRSWLEEKEAKSALVVGGGFIGLEMADNLAHRGLTVTVVERAEQLLPPLDPEMAVPVREWLEGRGVTVLLGDGMARFDESSTSRLLATTGRGRLIEADVAIVSVGVAPETGLARAAGLALGVSGGIVVDEAMRTSDAHIWAVGDAVETVDAVTGARQVLPLAGPANRQGRVAAEAICGRGTHFRGVQGTAVCGVFGLTVAMTGASEKSLVRAGITDFERVYLHPGHHVAYYPGAKPIRLKVLHRRSDGRVLGAQAVGEEGVEKRIDVIAMAVQMGATVHDLAESELCYAPQFGGAKDPVNLAGFIAVNELTGDMPLMPWSAVGSADAAFLDVREPAEVAQGSLRGAVHIPLHQLRQRWRELPKGQPIGVLCAAGQRAYYAVRFLRQMGVDARNLSGGWQTWRTLSGK